VKGIGNYFFVAFDFTIFLKLHRLKLLTPQNIDIFNSENIF